MEWPEFTFIEDNCEGLFGIYENQNTGTASLATSISFYANKTVTCGEGGALIVNDKDVFSILERQYSQGQTSTRYVHDMLAYNYRMTNIQASILIEQLKIKDEILNKKNNIFNFYRDNLSKYFVAQENSNNTEHSKWMFAVRLKGANYHKDISKNISDFETRPMFYPMSSHSHLLKYSKPEEEGVAKLLSTECFMLPSHPGLSEKNLEFIISHLNGMVK
jgi:perosamine synthetase